MNEPTNLERAAGYALARKADQAAAARPATRERCTGCAFRMGTDANTYGPTLLTATKCVLEREPFYCHEAPPGEEPICAGWALLSEPGAKPTEAPWPFPERLNAAARTEQGG